MADGEINRNGATIRIDDDGGVQVEPADGQEVEYTGPDRGTDAIRDSVNTDRLKLSEKVIAEKIEEKIQDTTTSDPVTFDFGGLETNETYAIIVNGESNDDGAVELKFNNSNSERYNYWDESGTKVNDQTEFKLIEYAGAVDLHTTIYLQLGTESRNERAGFNQRYIPVRSDRVNSYATNGGWMEFTTVESAQITITDGAESDTKLELWRVF